MKVAIKTFLCGALADLSAILPIVCSTFIMLLVLVLYCKGIKNGY